MACQALRRCPSTECGFLVVSRIAIMLTIEKLFVLHVLSDGSPTDFVLEAVASVAQSCPQYHRVNLEAVEQDRIAHIPLTRPCLRMQSERSVPAPATTQHRLMHLTCPDFQRMAMIWTSLHHHGPQSQAYKPSRSRCPPVYQSS